MRIHKKTNKFGSRQQDKKQNRYDLKQAHEAQKKQFTFIPNIFGRVDKSTALFLMTIVFIAELTPHFAKAEPLASRAQRRSKAKEFESHSETNALTCSPKFNTTNLIETTIPTNAPTDYIYSSPHFDIYKQDSQFIQLLYRRLEFYDACKIGNTTQITQMIKNGFNTEFDECIEIAFKNKHSNVLELLIKTKKMPPDWQDHSALEHPALHLSIIHKIDSLLELLIKQGADWYKTNSEGFNTLDVALIEKNSFALKHILEKGYDIKHRNGKNMDMADTILLVQNINSLENQDTRYMDSEELITHLDFLGPAYKTIYSTKDDIVDRFLNVFLDRRNKYSRFLEALKSDQADLFASLADENRQFFDLPMPYSFSKTFKLPAEYIADENKLNIMSFAINKNPARWKELEKSWSKENEGIDESIADFTHAKKIVQKHAINKNQKTPEQVTQTELGWLGRLTYTTGELGYNLGFGNFRKYKIFRYLINLAYNYPNAYPYIAAILTIATTVTAAFGFNLMHRCIKKSISTSVLYLNNHRFKKSQNKLDLIGQKIINNINDKFSLENRLHSKTFNEDSKIYILIYFNLSHKMELTLTQENEKIKVKKSELLKEITLQLANKFPESIINLKKNEFTITNLKMDTIGDVVLQGINNGIIKKFILPNKQVATVTERLISLDEEEDKQTLKNENLKILQAAADKIVKHFNENIDTKIANFEYKIEKEKSEVEISLSHKKDDINEIPFHFEESKPLPIKPQDLLAKIKSELNQIGCETSIKEDTLVIKNVKYADLSGQKLEEISKKIFRQLRSGCEHQPNKAHKNEIEKPTTITAEMESKTTKPCSESKDEEKDKQNDDDNPPKKTGKAADKIKKTKERPTMTLFSPKTHHITKKLEPIKDEEKKGSPQEFPNNIKNKSVDECKLYLIERHQRIRNILQTANGNLDEMSTFALGYNIFRFYFVLSEYHYKTQNENGFDHRKAKRYTAHFYKQFRDHFSKGGYYTIDSKGTVEQTLEVIRAEANRLEKLSFEDLLKPFEPPSFITDVTKTKVDSPILSDAFEQYHTHDSTLAAVTNMTDMECYQRIEQGILPRIKQFLEPALNTTQTDNTMTAKEGLRMLLMFCGKLTKQADQSKDLVNFLNQAYKIRNIEAHELLYKVDDAKLDLEVLNVCQSAITLLSKSAINTLDSEHQIKIIM